MNFNKFPFILFSVGLVFSLVSVWCLLPKSAEAAEPSFYLAPSQGTFLTGSTFNVSIFIDTKESEINAIELDLKFPSDILQVTSPTAGKSFVAEWIIPPSYSNAGGTISFKGGIPEGIVTSAGLVSTITFRAKSPGRAKIEFLDSSKILLADGMGTPIFTTNIGGTYEILIPPPEGPKVFSPTHPDSDIWYSDSNPSFSWEKEERVTDFSYSFSGNPKESPDITPEGNFIFNGYEDVSDGILYFHLRQKKDGVWGRTTHSAVKIDTTSPQEFALKVDSYSGFAYFKSDDVHSGIDYYEISVINFSRMPLQAPFFIEAASPYKIPYAESGKYKAIVRAYDRAGNFQETELEFQKLSPFVSLVGGEGIQVKGFFLSWLIFFLILFLLLAVLIFFIFYISKPKTGFKKGIKEIKEALAEIKKIEEREESHKERREKFGAEKEKLEKKLKKE